jgi:hypothetical protein
MTARSGMANLLLELRGMTNAGTADYTLGSDTFWDDDHLQDKLDQCRQDLNRVPLVPIVEYNGGTAYYYDYYAPVGHLEAYDATDSSVFQVENSDGDAQGTALYTADYLRGVFRFAADQAGTAYYLRARSYDVNRAAALVWRAKAAHYAERFDVSTDNHRLTRSQLIAQCLEMAQQYDGAAGLQTGYMQRTDLT